MVPWCSRHPPQSPPIKLGSRLEYHAIGGCEAYVRTALEIFIQIKFCEGGNGKDLGASSGNDKDRGDASGDTTGDKGGKGGKKNNGGKNSGGKKAKGEQPDMIKLEDWLFGGQGQPVKSSRVLQSVQQRKAATRTDHLKSLHNVALRASRIQDHEYR